MVLEYQTSKLVKEHLVNLLGLFSVKNCDRFLKVFYDKLKLILLVLFFGNFFEEPLNDLALNNYEHTKSAEHN